MDVLSDTSGPTQLELGENSVDIEDVRNETKTNLIMLNGALKRLDSDLDLWAVLRSLLDEQGPAIAGTHSENAETDGAHDQN